MTVSAGDGVGDKSVVNKPDELFTAIQQAGALLHDVTDTAVTAEMALGEMWQAKTASTNKEVAEKPGKTTDDRSKLFVPDVPPPVNWVACDKCEKWRQLTEGSPALYQDKAFHCSYLSGVDCSTPEEAFDESPDGESNVRVKSGKSVSCPTCNLALERNHRGREQVSRVLERHYVHRPACRPLEETTPGTVASRIIDLSDRLPYRAVLRSVIVYFNHLIYTPTPETPTVHTPQSLSSHTLLQD